MQAKKIQHHSLPKAYSIALFEGADQKSFLVATEKEGPCVRFDLEGQVIEEVWPGPGGVMTMIQVPGTQDQILATHEFYSPNCGADDARIILAKKESDNNWSIHKLCDLAYVHRFGLVRNDLGQEFLVACTIKSACEYKEDWRFPGKIYVGPFSLDTSSYLNGEGLELEILKEDQLKNHGFFMAPDRSYCLIATDKGIYRLTPPNSQKDDWSYDLILEKAVSDICLVDLDGDGTDEMVTLSPFHGDQLAIYKPDEEGHYRSVYEHAEALPFLHAIYADEVDGKGFAFLGHRKGERNLLALSYDDKTQAYKLDVLDTDIGPANVCTYRHKGKTYLISADRETDAMDLYELSTEKI